MSRCFTAFALPLDLVSVAFPLVSAAIPTVDLAGWKSFVRSTAEAKPAVSGRVIGLRNGAGYLCGLMVYRIDRGLKHGLTFAVDLFVALDLVNQTAAAQALLQAAEAKAVELSCAVVNVRLGLEQAALARCVNAHGYRSSASLYFKDVPQPLTN